LSSSLNKRLIADRIGKIYLVEIWTFLMEDLKDKDVTL